jgi:hypothetical protein
MIKSVSPLDVEIDGIAELWYDDRDSADGASDRRGVCKGSIRRDCDAMGWRPA